VTPAELAPVPSFHAPEAAPGAAESPTAAGPLSASVGDSPKENPFDDD